MVRTCQKCEKITNQTLALAKIATSTWVAPSVVLGSARKLLDPLRLTRLGNFSLPHVGYGSALGETQH